MSNASGPAPVKQIEVLKHFASDVCTGYCVDEIVTVRKDGYVLWRTEGAYFQRARRPTERLFFVGPDAAMAFLRAMNEVEPTASSSDRAGCDAELHVPNVWDWEISWKKSGPSTRLKSCDPNGRVASAWRAGLKGLGMPWGLAGELDKNVNELPTE